MLIYKENNHEKNTPSAISLSITEKTIMTSIVIVLKIIDKYNDLLQNLKDSNDLIIMHHLLYLISLRDHKY